MKLSAKALAWTGALLCGVCVLLAGIINLIFPTYGVAFLNVIRSIYPGYAAMTGFAGVIVGTLYAALGGAICGFLVGWVYNLFAKRESAPAA